jgi:hypothetical protein
MNDLYEVFDGSIGLIYWYEKTTKEITEDEAFLIRQRSMSNSINSAIQNAIYNGNGTEISIAMQKGWYDAKSQIDTIENGTVMKSMALMIGIPNLLDIIKQTEESMNFRGWTNSFLIDQIKDHYRNSHNA